MNGERMRYARRMLTGEAPPRADIPCSICSRYQALRSARRWLSPDTRNPERRDSLWLAWRRFLVSPRRVVVALPFYRRCARKLATWFRPVRPPAARG